MYRTTPTMVRHSSYLEVLEVSFDLLDNATKQLQRKLRRDTRTQVRDRYFRVRILPMLLVWAVLWVLVTWLFADAVSLGVAIIVFCGVTLGIVVWLHHRAAAHAADNR
jgi:Flp pilus assembly protein TadB